MRQKTLDDFSDYAKISSTVEALRREQQEIAQRIEEIGLELSKSKQLIDGQDAWSLALEGKGFHAEIDVASSLKEEFQLLEGRQRFVTDALAVGVMVLDSCRGKYSIELCQSVRPQWTAEVKAILESLKRICEANESLDRLRRELEDRNIRTDSLPYSKYDIGGSWSDPFGGRVVGYQREASENFPEVAAAAGMAIKSKLKALIDRERAFDNQGVTE
jgi:hypothetical protein